MSKSISPDTIIGHYRVVSQIGAGGMGEVYLAEDTRLHRKVALKILPADFSSNRDRMRRFEQEATSAAALNHPNIAHIYEIGESEGTHFIAMEFVDGRTLRETIHQEKSELRVLLKHLLQVAEGLAKAHGSGIVHRDLKPDNIMITRDGHAKILDFGLAKLVETSRPDPGQSEGGEAPTAVIQQHSVPGMIMGTVGYMSPEQAKAKTVDQRSDIFSFGCLLYEAATGRRPFAGDSVVDSLHKIIHDPAPAITGFYPSASPELQRVIRKCLAKEPEKRYQTIRDTANDLEELIEEMKGMSDIERSMAPSASTTTSGVTKSTDDDMRGDSTLSVSPQPASSAEYIVTAIKQHKIAIAVIAGLVLIAVAAGVIGVGVYLHARNTEVAIESIAVLPFENQNRDPNTDYLSDGITESIINSLTQVPNLRVIARSSVFRYKGKSTDPLAVGKELGVRAVLVGRMMQRGDNLTISTELVDVRDNKQLWGEQYDRKAADLMAMQREIAGQIANNLRLKISGEAHNRMMKSYTANAEAYQLYLRGRFYGSKRTAKDAQKSIEYFQQAAALDPNYALAYAGLAESNWFLALYSYPQVNEVVPKARELARKALELDNSLAEPHSVLGVICFNYDRDFACMERETKLGIELNPSYAEGHRRYGLLLQNLGRFEEARIAIRRALEIDPLSPVTNLQYAQLLFYERKYDESEALSKKNVELDPNFWYAHWQLFYVYRMKRDYASAVEELAKVQDARGEPDAEAVVRELEQRYSQKVADGRDLAVVYAGLDEKDKAFAWVEKAFQDHSFFLAGLKLEPLLEPLHNDPRWSDLERRIGLPQ